MTLFHTFTYKRLRFVAIPANGALLRIIDFTGDDYGVFRSIDAFKEASKEAFQPLGDKVRLAVVPAND